MTDVSTPIPTDDLPTPVVDVVGAFDKMIKVYIARYIHQSTNDEPVHAAQQELADALTVFGRYRYRK